MNRISFIRNVAALAFGTALPTRLARSYQKIYLSQCFVAGFQFSGGPERLAYMSNGDLLDLRREPENPEDPRAIALYHNENKIGFVPKRENKTLSRLLDADMTPLVAEITHLNKDAATWENVRIAIYMLKEKHGPLPSDAAYLTQVKEPSYRSVAAGKKSRKRNNDNWHDTLVQQSKTDHIYSLIYGDLYPDFGGPNHDSDFVVVRESRMPSYFRDVYVADVSGHMRGIAPPYGKKDYMVMRTDRLSNYLEAAKGMKEVYNDKGNNFIELIF